MKKKKKLTIRVRTEHNIESLSLREYRDMFLELRGEVWFCKTKRDLTVQRKGVWPLTMQQEYFADLAVGNADNNPLHYIELESSRDYAEKSGQYNFALHLSRFLDAGHTDSPIDGGNRTDSIILTLTNIIKVAAGVYDYGYDDDGDKLFFTVEEPIFFCDLDKKLQNVMLDYGRVLICRYYNLSKDERKKLFKKLNDGMPLIDEELINSEESDVCTINRTTDLEYSSLFVSSGALTESGADRWKLAHNYLPSLKYASRNLIITKKGEVVVKWPSFSQLVPDYIVGSDADRHAEKEQEDIKNNFIPFLKIFSEKNKKFIDRGLYIDLYLMLSLMRKEGYNLAYPVTKKIREEFLTKIAEQYKKWAAEDEPNYISKFSKKKPVMVSFDGLYTKNNNLVINQRLQRWHDEFIKPNVGKFIIKVEKRSKITNKIKAKTFIKQKGKTPKGEKIDPLKLNDFNIDHVESLRQGGADEETNYSYISANDNKSKGARKI